MKAIGTMSGISKTCLISFSDKPVTWYISYTPAASSSAPRRLIFIRCDRLEFKRFCRYRKSTEKNNTQRIVKSTLQTIIAMIIGVKTFTKKYVLSLAEYVGLPESWAML